MLVENLLKKDSPSFASTSLMNFRFAQASPPSLKLGLTEFLTECNYSLIMRTFYLDLNKYW